MRIDNIGVLRVKGTSDTSYSGNGIVVVSGGIGVAKNARIGGNMISRGYIFTSCHASTSVTPIQAIAPMTSGQAKCVLIGS